MAYVIKSRAQQVVEQRTGRELPELLRELYVGKRWTDQEIADHLEVGSRTTILAWRQDFGISRADRAVAVEAVPAVDEAPA